MVDWFWLPVLLLATLPAGAFAGYLVFAHKANNLYTRGRREGWQARVRYERALQQGQVVKPDRGEVTVS